MRALARDGDNPDAIDPRLSAIAFAARVADLELARQVIEIAGGVDELGRLVRVR